MDVLLADSFAGMRGVIIEKINQNNKFTDALDILPYIVKIDTNNSLSLLASTTPC